MNIHILSDDDVKNRFRVTKRELKTTFYRLEYYHATQDEWLCASRSRFETNFLPEEYLSLKEMRDIIAPALADNERLYVSSNTLDKWLRGLFDATGGVIALRNPRMLGEGFCQQYDRAESASYINTWKDEWPVYNIAGDFKKNLAKALKDFKQSVIDDTGVSPELYDKIFFETLVTYEYEPDDDNCQKAKLVGIDKVYHKICDILVGKTTYAALPTPPVLGTSGFNGYPTPAEARQYADDMEKYMIAIEKVESF